MRILVDTAPLRPPFTGIANYQFSILEAALTSGGAVFGGVALGRWHTLDMEALEALREGAAGARQSGRTAGKLPASATRRAASAAWRRLPGATAVRGSYYAWRVGAELRKFDPGLFHAFNFVAPFRPAGIPILPLVHDLSHMRHPEFHTAARRLALAGVKKACALAPLVHTVSDYSSAEIAALLDVPKARIVAIPPAVGDTFRAEPKVDDAVLRAHLLKRQGYALFVGSLEPRKNLAILLDAYRQLKPAERRAMPLAVAGAEGWGGVSQDPRLVALEREGAVRRLGYVADAELATLYAAARVFLFPSHYEGYGMPVGEALACGAPVVASNRSAIPQAAGGQALLLPPDDADAWAQALRQAIDDDRPLGDRLRKARRKAALARSWSDAAREMLAMYRLCIAAGRR
jgi:alpha-1,3-rhamnosyl/mannosyltransferase